MSGPGDPSPFVLRPMGAERRRDFERLHSERNGMGWCQCVAWWVASWDGFGERSQAQNQALRRELFERGEYDGRLLYEGEESEEAVGWCQVGPRDRLTKLVEQFELEPDPGAWALTCFAVVPAARGRGAARAMLRGVIEELAERAARGASDRPTCLQAFPRRARAELDALDLWNGPEALFRAEGFREVGQGGERLVMQRDI